MDILNSGHDCKGRRIMKIIKKIMYFILGLLGLFCGFVLVCVFRPDIGEAIAEFLYPDQSQNIKAEISNNSEYDLVFDIGENDEIADVKAYNDVESDFNPERDDNQEEANTESDRQGIGKDIVSDYLVFY